MASVQEPQGGVLETAGVQPGESFPETPGLLVIAENHLYYSRGVSTCSCRLGHAQGQRKPHPERPDPLQLIPYHEQERNSGMRNYRSAWKAKSKFNG